MNSTCLAIGSVLIPASGIFATVVFNIVHPDINEMRQRNPDLTIEDAKRIQQRRRLIVLAVFLLPGIVFFGLGLS